MSDFEETKSAFSVWSEAGRALDMRVSPAWACSTNEVERCLARESVVPVVVQSSEARDDEEEDEEEDEENRGKAGGVRTTMPLWLVESLARQDVDVRLDTQAPRQGNDGARTLSLFSERALEIVRVNPKVVNFGTLPSFYATGAAVLVAQGGMDGNASALDRIMAQRLEDVGTKAANMDSSDVAAYTQLLARPEKTFFEAVHGDAIALNEWREQKPLHITPSAYVTAAQDASGDPRDDNPAKRQRLV